MSEPEKGPVQGSDLSMGRPPEEFAAYTFPTVFADAVLSVTQGQEVVKFYLFRLDPNMFGQGGSKANPFAQVIMPTAGFLQSVMFLMQQVEEMQQKGLYTKEQVEQARALFLSQKKSETGDAR